jgi:hypothetical protein
MLVPQPSKYSRSLQDKDVIEAAIEVDIRVDADIHRKRRRQAS